MTTDTAINLEAAAKYGNLCRVAMDFYLSTGNPAEARYAYLNARWAARLALAEMNGHPINACSRCGQDRSYEHGVGDRSGLCSRQACGKAVR